MVKVIWSEPALDDLRGVIEFIARDSDVYAERLGIRLVTVSYGTNEWINCQYDEAGNRTRKVVIGPGNQDADYNTNGIPDAWELGYFRRLEDDPLADHDGDRAINWNEYWRTTSAYWMTQPWVRLCTAVHIRPNCGLIASARRRQIAEPLAELPPERSGRSPTLQKWRKRPVLDNGGTTSVSSAEVLQGARLFFWHGIQALLAGWGRWHAVC